MGTFEKMRADFLEAVRESRLGTACNLANAIAERQRKTLFKACVKHLRPNGLYKSIFGYASHYARTAVSNELTVDSESYEISGMHTKDGFPFVVYFD